MPAGAPPALLNAHLGRPVREVLETLAAAGHRSWLVGGTVRDLLLHRPHADADVATPATPDQVLRLFRRVIPTGVEHGTVTVVVEGTRVEVTTFRGEGEYRDGRRPSSVTFLDDVDGDLARRDFTMNAMAWDPLARELRDPFGGRADLHDRIIRAVGDPAARFGEDGLRPLRAARFAAQLGFAIEPATRAAIPGALGVTAKVAVERVSDELTKLLRGEHVHEGLELLAATRLLDVVIPEVAALDAAGRSHAFRAVAEAARPRLDLGPAGPDRVALLLAALLHAPSDGGAAPPAERARAALERLRYPRQVIEDASALVTDHACLLHHPRGAIGDGAAARRWVARVGPRLAAAALALWRACARSLPSEGAREALREQQRTLRRVRRALAEDPPLSTSALALDGRAAMQILKVPPGRVVGEALRHLLELVLEEPALNTRPALERALRAWWESRPESR